MTKVTGFCAQPVGAGVELCNKTKGRSANP